MTPGTREALGEEARTVAKANAPCSKLGRERSYSGRVGDEESQAWHGAAVEGSGRFWTASECRHVPEYEEDVGGGGGATRVSHGEDDFCCLRGCSS